MKARFTALPHSNTVLDQLAAVDKEWHQQRQRMLDWDREPQSIGFCSVAITTTCFIVLWSLLQLVERTILGPAAAMATVLMLYSPRAVSFANAFLAYQRRRAALA